MGAFLIHWEGRSRLVLAAAKAVQVWLRDDAHALVRLLLGSVCKR